MAAQDYVGRINKEAFLSAFLGLAIAGVIDHFMVRFAVQKQCFQIDDGLLVMAFVFLLASQNIICTIAVHQIILMTAIQDGLAGVEIPSNVLEIAEVCHR
ncbi:uncharacterized protein N7503_001259 [Penicillium pulvis]|uniref:uncharacterized protein n=1 Tax=Penicillium pulvis TaxID=1562058 RepID=UPI002547656F|nr:uncharacterized protein N7503_001259 [Penicillium pulvis]KAJ5809041.1 hypothetical protein N7503_001259 [Penicillium pulvis]